MDEIFSPGDLVRLHRSVTVIWGKDEPMPLAQVRAELHDAVALVCAGWRYGDVLDWAPRLRAIIDVRGGFPTELNYDRCYDRRIRVLTAAPAFGPQVAEMALGLALAASRGITAADRAFRAGTERWLHAGNVDSFLLYGKPVGFIGYGNLARSLQPLLAPFGCSLAAYDPWLAPGHLRAQHVEPVDLEQLLATSLVIFVLAAPTRDNQALLSRTHLERIRQGAVLVLLSRAHVVDFDALTDLVLAGRFKAAIDVFPTEPLPHDHPIRHAEGAVLSAHRAGSVPEGLREIGTILVDDLEAMVRGFPPQRLQVAQPEIATLYTVGAAKQGMLTRESDPASIVP
jgi:phosphoglycerate dehydrogenase-like enzyme